MDRPPSTQPDSESRSVLHHIHQFGSQAAAVFSRLYGTIQSNDDANDLSGHTSRLTLHIAKTESRYRMMQQIAEERSVDVAQMHTVLERVGEGVIMLDDTGTITFSNVAAQRMLGAGLQRFSQTILRQQPALSDNSQEIMPLGQAQTVNVQGRKLSVQVVAVTDEAEQETGSLILLRDVTQHDISDRIRESFLSHISHELVTPITSATYAKEFLVNAPSDQPANRRMLEKIGRNIDVLARLVDDMLEMAIINSEDFQITYEPLPLDQLLQELVAGFADEIAHRQLEIWLMPRDYEDLRQFMGDRKYLVLALTQLLRNAILYNEPGQQIIVTAGVDRRNAQEVFIAVSDTGVGISQEDMPYVFDLYHRGEPRTRAGKRLDPRGLGQGLYMANKITQAHGGRMTAASNLGEGSRFTLVLPRFVNGNKG